MYKNGRFHFTFNINNNYPHDPPKVKCTQKIYHPNIDLEGNVCLNILREDWKPVLNLNSVMVGLQFLFIEPNPADPLNKGILHFCQCPAVYSQSLDAATDLSRDREKFKKNVKTAMNGGRVGSETFDVVV